MNSEYILKCEEDTKNMAKDIAPFLKNNITFLNGEIGAGKTTFTKYLVEVYGLSDEVCSPTFALENRYETKNGLIIHFDLYRIKSEEELAEEAEEADYHPHRCGHHRLLQGAGLRCWDILSEPDQSLSQGLCPAEKEADVFMEVGSSTIIAS